MMGSIAGNQPGGVQSTNFGQPQNIPQGPGPIPAPAPYQAPPPSNPHPFEQPPSNYAPPAPKRYEPPAQPTFNPPQNPQPASGTKSKVTNLREFAEKKEKAKQYLQYCISELDFKRLRAAKDNIQKALELINDLERLEQS
eukprot:TRINITY_DN941_c0_g1_i2.p2 TRINITY_DN941_c0_g1~~TRINITY_DN941_c0_g1_i2.p2  ORF type:complete len:140 (+),score=44.17 TRINITY_DN941_c0_g1_i2:780-1199(+)